MGTETLARRAFVSLAAAGAGHFTQPWEAKTDVLPRYALGIQSMLCSFRQWRSAYPMVVLAVNLSSGEQAALRASGAARVLDVSWFDMLPFAVNVQHGLLHVLRGKDCRMNASNGQRAWFVSNRDDMHKTMFKALAWNLTEYDEVAFVDADMAFVASPDAVFTALRPALGVSKGVLAESPRATAWVCTREQRESSAVVPRCPALDFAGALSVRPRCPRTLGWQGGFFVTRTSEARFHALLRRGASGDFDLFVNGEVRLRIAVSIACPRGLCARSTISLSAHTI